MRISLPTGFLDSVAVKKFISTVKVQYPYIQLQLIPNDEIADLMSEQIDIAIRAAEPDPNSSLVARYLTQWRLCICASPDYLAEKPIHTVADLRSRTWINYHDTIFRNTFAFLGLGDMPLENPVSCSSIIASRSLAIAGFGLTLLLSKEVEKFINNRELAIVLPEIEMPSYNLYAVTAHRVQSAKIEGILQLLKRSFEE
ncbi:LysR substrate-binding domain-containing protein [Actinobacillus capsulatus]|uniref:LysR substrate-binding domain-containing protein n=1 Tax=Actinobacillus capsulatus TaxID=717 RepID=UPI00039E3436|nr:LysR substrate-binding domain-containing protein [Actinobacillus capsulatus]